MKSVSNQRALAACAAVGLMLALGAGPALAGDPASGAQPPGPAKPGDSSDMGNIFKLESAPRNLWEYSSAEILAAYDAQQRRLRAGGDANVVLTPPNSSFVFSLNVGGQWTDNLRSSVQPSGPTSGGSGGTTPGSSQRMHFDKTQWWVQGATGFRPIQSQPSVYVGLDGGVIVKGPRKTWDIGAEFARNCKRALVDLRADYVQGDVDGLRAGNLQVTVPYFTDPNTALWAGTGALTGSIETKSIIVVGNPTEGTTTETVFKREGFTEAPFGVGFSFKRRNLGFDAGFVHEFGVGRARSSDRVAVRFNYYFSGSATLADEVRANPSRISNLISQPVLESTLTRWGGHGW